jgi:hypothetical protein
MSVKLLVLYPTPTDLEQFDRQYERILGSPAGTSPFARLTEVTFPTLKALQECATRPGAQKTLAHAVQISTGGAPHFMIVEEEG